MSEIVPLRVVEGPVEVNQDVVTVLEDLLADAKAGKVVAVGFVYARPNHMVGTGWSSRSSLATHLLVSGVASLMARLTRAD